MASLVGFAPSSALCASKQPEKPNPSEKSQPGDIPDNQVFIDYRSPLGFNIKVPEGWARRETSDRVTFRDKYNTIALVVSQRSDAIGVVNAKQQEVADLEKAGRAVRMTGVKSVKLPSGPAVVVSYARIPSRTR